VVESLAVDRIKRGLEVEVLTSLDRRSRNTDPSGAAFVRRLPSWEFANTVIMPGLAGALLKLPRRSVVHLHVAQAFVPEVVYATHHLLRGQPYVAQLHLDVGPSGWAGFLLHAYKPLILGPVLRAAAAVVVFTDEQRAVVASKYGVDPLRIAVIPNGVDERFFNTGERFLHSKPRLLFVGRLSVQKNLLLFLRALDGVSDRFDTTLVGDGGLEAELRRAAAKLRLQNVRFYGHADGAELVELYREADLFVLPSEREGMPLVLLEAMAMGLPIVATDVPGSRDIVVQGHNGVLVPLGDPVAFRRALLHVTGDSGMYRRMSDRSRHLVDKYSWRTVGAEFERVYSSLSER
jgi:glycosyltransferase involved in cell wall biosynthesis